MFAFFFEQLIHNTGMKIKSSIFKLVFVVVAWIGTSAHSYADFTCNIDLAYGLVVNKSQLRVLDETRTVLQINDYEQLFIGGRMIVLDPKEQQLLTDYAKGLHYVVPKMIVIATEGVDLAAETIEHVYLGLVGSDHDSYKKLHGAMKRVKMRVKEKYRRASSHYFIGPGSLESVDEFVDREIEAQLEEAINTSVGGILSAVGGVDTNSGNNSDRVEEITRQLEAMGEQLERDVAPRADTLRKKAEWFCRKLEKLNKTEEALRKSVPEFTKYNIITVD